MGGGMDGMRSFELSNTNCDCTGMGPANWLGRHIWDIRVTSITKSALQVRTHLLSISTLLKAPYPFFFLHVLCLYGTLWDRPAPCSLCTCLA